MKAQPGTPAPEEFVQKEESKVLLAFLESWGYVYDDVYVPYSKSAMLQCLCSLLKLIMSFKENMV